MIVKRTTPIGFFLITIAKNISIDGDGLRNGIKIEHLGEGGVSCGYVDDLKPSVYFCLSNM